MTDIDKPEIIKFKKNVEKLVISKEKINTKDITKYEKTIEVILISE